MEATTQTASTTPITVTGTSETSGASTQTAQTATPNTASTSSVDWTSSMPDDLKGYVQTKGFKDLASVVDSYRNFEKLIGVPKDRLMKLPDKEDAPEWNDVWDKLGKPKEAKDYQLEVPEGVDPSTAQWAKDIFHKNNVTKKQGEAIVKEWNARAQASIQAETQQVQLKMEQQESALKKEWGAAYEQNNQIADRALDLFGESATEVVQALGKAIGFDKTLKTLHALGSKLGEDAFVGGDRNTGSFGGKLTPQQAKYKIDSLKSDPEFTRRYIAGESGPREEMQRLHEMLVSGQ